MDASSSLKAVIFDLDGVLTDTSKHHARAWAAIVKEAGLTPPPGLEERVKGISRDAALRLALGESVSRFTIEELQELAAKKNQLYLDSIKNLGPQDLLPGVINLFEALKKEGIKIVLGSASKNA